MTYNVLYDSHKSIYGSHWLSRTEQTLKGVNGFWKDQNCDFQEVGPFREVGTIWSYQPVGSTDI